jgi:hypothetical protein
MKAKKWRNQVTISRFSQYMNGALNWACRSYLRQLTEFGYLESHGGNRNRSYRLKNSFSE